MIHEEQVRQLCAIHTVNNLLQLPADLDHDSCGISDSICKEDTDADDEVDQSNGCKQPNQVTHMWTCHGRIIRRYKQSTEDGIHYSSSVDMTPPESAGKDTTKSSKQNIIWRVATKEEFDNIARELTMREQMLLSGDKSTLSSATSSNKEASTRQATKLNNLSLMQQIRSPYGSPYFGNYSLDVIKEALTRRGVELEFYRVSDDNDITAIYDSNEKDTKNADANNNDITTSTSCNKCLIGFVIYEKEENQRSALSVLSRIGSHIPVVKNFCGVGQHWYAITGVQYQLSTSKKNDTNKGKEDTNTSSWYIIDSKIGDISTLETDNELVNLLKEIQKEGALLFRAFIESSK